MKTAHQGREKIRAQLLKRYCVYEALYLLSNSISADNRTTFVESKETILRIDSKPRLTAWLHGIESEIKKLRQHYGVKVSDAELVEIATQVEGAPGSSIAWMNKYGFGELFSHPERMLPNFNTYPAHIYIGIDPGKYRTSGGVVELFLLEAKIFEDLAALFNIAKADNERLDPVTDGKQAHKRHDAVCRAVISYSVFFVEAYLNGIAFDYYLTNATALDKDKETKGLLLDWDFSRDRPRYISLRDKALKYPRIILGRDHSPVQESNTPELRIILERATRIRDIIAHPSVRKKTKETDCGIFDVFFSVDFKSLEEVVDAAVGLVRKIETTLRGDASRLDWLHGRGPDGKFPDSVFN